MIMKAPQGITLQDYGFIEPPPAYEDIVNEQPPRPVPRTNLARSHQVSTSLTSMRDEPLIPEENVSLSVRQLAQRFQNRPQQAAELPSKPSPPRRLTDRRSFSPSREQTTGSTTSPDRYLSSSRNYSSYTNHNQQQQTAEPPLKPIPPPRPTNIRSISPNREEKTDITTGPNRFSFSPQNVASPPNRQQQAAALPPKLKPVFDSSSTRIYPPCESERSSNTATALPPKLKPLFDSSSTRSNPSCESEKTSNSATALPMKLKPLFDSSSTRNDSPCESEKTSNPAQNYSTGGNTTTLSIPTEVVRHVKGKKGNRLETIQGSTGTTIQFIANATNPSITEIKISGTSQGIANAESYVFGLLETTEELQEFESVNIARHFLPTIMEWEKLKIIQFFKETTVFFEIRDGKLFLKGFSEEDVDNAEVKLHEILVQALVNTSTTPFLETYVPESFVGMIIGKEGAKINKLREKTGAKIIITKEDDLNGQRKVRLEGSEEQISAAKAEIDQLIFSAKQYNTRDTLPGNEKLIRIPKSLGGIIVGAGGKTIASMKNNSGAQIVLTNVDFETSVIQICGEPANVAEAERLVFNKLRWNKELKKMPCNSVPAAALSKWRNPKIVEFFSRTGCFLEVTNSDVEIKGFNIDEMFAAEEELQNMVEDASYNKEINMAWDQSAHNLGRLNLNQQKTSPSSTPALRKMSDDSPRKSSQSTTRKNTPASPPELNKPKLDCADIALLVNPMLESWSSDDLIVFQRETCTTIRFDYSSLTLEGLCIEDLYATKNKLFQRAQRARGGVLQTEMVTKTKKVFIGGLSASSTLEDMKAYFEQYGKVEDSMLVFDNATQRHRGFGFITFDNEDVSDKVCEIHFHEINGKMVECKKAQPKEVMLPVQLNKSRAAAARNLYGLPPEQLLAYATYLPRFGYGNLLYPGMGSMYGQMPNYSGIPSSPGSTTGTGRPQGFDAAMYASLNAGPFTDGNLYMSPQPMQHNYHKV